jgi:hypothetical protein
MGQRCVQFHVVSVNARTALLIGSAVARERLQEARAVGVLHGERCVATRFDRKVVA